MSDKENEVDNEVIDPPENTGGGNVTGAGVEQPAGTDAAPIDPPENTGGGN
jgi:hypothetical protein